MEAPLLGSTVSLECQHSITYTNTNLIAFQSFVVIFTDLLGEFEEEDRLIDSLEQRMVDLTQEMEDLIETFTNIQQRLRDECYRTP